jgi:molybdate transport system substrate-binding protein
VKFWNILPSCKPARGRFEWGACSAVIFRGKVPALCFLAFGVGLAAVFLAYPTGTFAREPNIAAASSLNYVLPQIAARFQETNGHSVKLIFGSSTSLVQQILAGAPFEVFLSADTESAAVLIDHAVTEGPAIVYGQGRLALFTMRGSAVALSPDLKLLGDPSSLQAIGRFAIANPEVAPYGQISREALQAAGVWERIADRLVIGQNAMQTAQFAVSGSVDAALIPYSIAVDPRFIDRGTSVLLADTLYRPLDHVMVLLRGAGDGAKAFFSFLQSDFAKSTFRQSGL